MLESSLATPVLQDLYARMLLTRLVDDCAWRLHIQGHICFETSCRGHEAAQVGSAVCIEVGKDFTLPYYRDLGVVLTIGMTPYEVLRTYLHVHRQQAERNEGEPAPRETVLHWGYHKHNMVTGAAPVATQILHAAGIAFASKLRRAQVITVAYCGDSAIGEADFLEGIRFAAQHQLPMIIICEQDYQAEVQGTHQPLSETPSLETLALPPGLLQQRIDGSDVLAVYTAMQSAIQWARTGKGPILLEMCVQRSHHLQTAPVEGTSLDPLVRCQQLLEARGEWDEAWAAQLEQRLTTEVEAALQDALRTL